MILECKSCQKFLVPDNAITLTIVNAVLVEIMDTISQKKRMNCTKNKLSQKNFYKKIKNNKEKHLEKVVHQFILESI